MKRFLKVLHTLGAVGLMGGFASVLVLAGAAAAQPPEALAAVRAGLEVVATWLLLPSLLLVVLSGLLGIGVHRPFHNAGWVWLKAATGVLLFEATLHLQASAKDAALLSRLALEGEGDAAILAEVLRGERLGLLVLLGVCLANVVLGVWRPRLTRAPALPEAEEPPLA